MRPPYALRRNSRFPPSALAAGLVLALAGAAGRSDAVEVPLSWPLAGEDRGPTTPLRAAIEAMRLVRAPASTPRARVAPVTRCDDDGGPGTLRDAVENALNGDLVDLTQLACSTITLGGALEIAVNDLWLRGPAGAGLVIDGGASDRVFYKPLGGTLTIENLVVANGRFVAEGNQVGFGGCIASAGPVRLVGSTVRDCWAQGVGAYGGAVLSGVLTMKGSTISGNTAFGDHPTNGTAAYGGGAFAYGIDMVDSTISGNRAIGTHNAPLSHWEIGGGLFVARNGGTIERSTIDNNYAMRFAGGLAQEDFLTLRNSTISGNVARDDDGGGLRVKQVTNVAIHNSTITANVAGSFGGGISFSFLAGSTGFTSSIISGNFAGADADIGNAMPLVLPGSHNLIGAIGVGIEIPADSVRDDAQLLPLAANGGRTRTHALDETSPAIDAGTNADGLSTDQRSLGFAREFNGIADIGAYEFQPAPAGQIESVALPGLRAATAALLAMLLAWLGLAGMRRRI